MRRRARTDPSGGRSVMSVPTGTVENPMEDRGIELRLSVPVRRITLQIALDANVVKDLKGFICRVLAVVNAMNSTAHD